MPAPLTGAVVRRAVPWVELALGVGLLVAAGSALAVVAALALGLFLGYLALVAIAWRGPEPVDCGCFGALGSTRVTGVTVLRNALLVVGAGLTVAGGLLGGGLSRTLDAAAVGWVLAALLTAAVAVAVAWRPEGPATDPGAAGAEPGEEYVRVPVPEAQALTADGRLVAVAEEARAAAQLLVFLRPGCGPCGRLGPRVAGWAAALAPVGVRAVVIGDPSSLARLPYLDATTWFDPHEVALHQLGLRTPSAVLLGTDGFLAGGPVRGEEAVVAFVEEVRAHLLEAAGGPGLTDAR